MVLRIPQEHLNRSLTPESRAFPPPHLFPERAAWQQYPILSLYIPLSERNRKSSCMFINPYIVNLIFFLAWSICWIWRLIDLIRWLLYELRGGMECGEVFDGGEMNGILLGSVRRGWGKSSASVGERPWGCDQFLHYCAQLFRLNQYVSAEGAMRHAPTLPQPSVSVKLAAGGCWVVSTLGRSRSTKAEVESGEVPLSEVKLGLSWFTPSR